MQALAKSLIRFRLPLLLGCLAITAAVFPLSLRIQPDRSVRAFFDPAHPRLLDYTSVQGDFSGDTLCLAVYSDPELLSSAGLARLGQFTERLARVPGVLRATSLANLRRPGNALMIRTLEEWFAQRNVDPTRLRDEILHCDLYADQFIGRDGETAAVALLIDPARMGSGEFTAALAELRRIAAESPSPARIVGAPVMINDVYDYLDEDSWVLANVSTLAMMGVIFVLFRNLRWMVLPILVVWITLIWTRALMAWWRLDLSLTGSLTTALLTVIGIGTAIHIVIRFQEEYGRDPDGGRALERTLRAVLPAVFWTCATTAAGFGSLFVSRVAPVRDFAWLMAFSAMAVFVASFTLIPGGALLGRRGIRPSPVPAEATIEWGLFRLGDWVNRHYFLATGLAALLLGSAGLGILRLEVETDFTRNFRAGSTILDGYQFVESRLGGAGFVELAIPAPKEIGPDFLNRLRECQQRLARLSGVTKVTSLADVLDFLSPSSAGGSSDTVRRMQLAALRIARPPELLQVWNPGRQRLRIILRVTERLSSREKDRLLLQIEQTAKDVLGDSATVTGLYVLLVHLIESLLGDQALSFAVSSVLIFAMTCVAFGGFRLGTVAFLPNLIPIALVMGAMGWLGLKINVATAMMSSISMGLTVDFSIHYLSRFRQERVEGADFFAALARTHRSTGKAMFCANLALMVGFSVLVFSHLLPTAQFGMLISIAMLGGLMGNLVMLPVLLRVAYWQWGPPPPLVESLTPAAVQ